LILTDREIQAAIQSKQIIINPAPNEDAYSSTSLDLTLSKSLRVWKIEEMKGVEHVICPATEGYKFPEFVRAYSDPRELGADGFVIKPHEFVLGWTEESIEIANIFSARG
jgi:dCTP deaminase